MGLICAVVSLVRYVSSGYERDKKKEYLLGATSGCVSLKLEEENMFI